VARIGIEENYKSWFSHSFVTAASAAAGMTCVPTGGQDFDGVDFTIRRGAIGIDLQLKATDSPSVNNDQDFVVDLDARTYNLFTSPRTNPGYLVLVTVGSDRSHWLRHSGGTTQLEHEARWVRVTGLPASDNSTSTRVVIPRQNLLTARALHDVMDLVEAEAR
jgi:hypothetical protein